MYSLNRLKKGILSSIAISSLLLFSGCGGTSTTSSSTSTTITAVDGYIKDANITDNLGQKATYSGANGKYTFSSSPSYPLHLTGGKLLDTNASFDINMTAQSGSTIISPITSFLGNDSTLLSKFANLGLNKSLITDFEVDYINTNDTNLSKLSQLLYAILKDANLTTTFKNSIASNEQNLSNLFIKAKISINSSSYKAKRKMKYFLNKIEDFNESASNMESFIKSFKNLLNSSSNDGNRTILKTGQTTSYVSNDDGNLSRGIVRSYTDNGDGTVSDNATTLIWQKEDDNITRNWSQSSNYCINLNLGGSTSWRLPTLEELFQLLDFGIPSPAINSIFINTKTIYWSSTADALGFLSAWNISFYTHLSNHALMGSTVMYVRCVRSAN